MEHTIKLKVNGISYDIRVQSKRSLLSVLRDDLGYIGVKEGCGAGECGACTIIMDGKAINSCMVLAVEADGSDILTIEGLSDGDNLHPIQKQFIEKGAIQCGFCTPGMILTTYEFLKRNPDPTEDEIKVAISGNLCRCTGYVQIIEAITAAAKEMKSNKEQ
ncbi:(2Fe-2S)-binding protein [Candidatus Dependentiae bacterium]|nr:(2Fe-2S)-binding protein [Candidatus Dependentiae bacterium]